MKEYTRLNELSTEVKAQEIHEKHHFGITEQNSIYTSFVRNKKLRDERLYKELGYSTFKEYCNQEWNLSRQTVYERIQIAESMNEQDFVSYNLHFGHNKTLLFTRMTDEQKEQSINEGIPTKQGYKSYDKATQKNC